MMLLRNIIFFIMLIAFSTGHRHNIYDMVDSFVTKMVEHQNNLKATIIS